MDPALTIIGGLVFGVLLVSLARRRLSDPRRCFDCGVAIRPGDALCEDCFAKWSEAR